MPLSPLDRCAYLWFRFLALAPGFASWNWRWDWERYQRKRAQGMTPRQALHRGSVLKP
jgi:hypothetical protein